MEGESPASALYHTRELKDGGKVVAVVVIRRVEVL